MKQKKCECLCSLINGSIDLLRGRAVAFVHTFIRCLTPTFVYRSIHFSLLLLTYVYPGWSNSFWLFAILHDHSNHEWVNEQILHCIVVVYRLSNKPTFSIVYASIGQMSRPNNEIYPSIVANRLTAMRKVRHLRVTTIELTVSLTTQSRTTRDRHRIIEVQRGIKQTISWKKEKMH